MLFITERKTAQRDLITGSILHMVSLFVVADQHEIFDAEGDTYKRLIADANSRGLLILPKIENMEPTLEASRTRKGVLLKLSVTELFPSEAKTPDVAPPKEENEPEFKPLKDLPNYEVSKDGRIRNIKLNKLMTPKGPNRIYKLSKNGVEQYVNAATAVKLAWG